MTSKSHLEQAEIAHVDEPSGGRGNVLKALVMTVLSTLAACCVLLMVLWPSREYLHKQEVEADVALLKAGSHQQEREMQALASKLQSNLQVLAARMDDADKRMETFTSRQHEFNKQLLSEISRMNEANTAMHRDAKKEVMDRLKYLDAVMRSKADDLPSPKQKSDAPNVAIPLVGRPTYLQFGITTRADNWDADASDDGVISVLYAKDANDKPVVTEGRVRFSLCPPDSLNPVHVWDWQQLDRSMWQTGVLGPYFGTKNPVKLQGRAGVHFLDFWVELETSDGRKLRAKHLLSLRL